MNVMRLVAAMALGYGLAGCAGTLDPRAGHPAEHPSGPDGAWCGTPDATGPVYVEIHYAGDGTPSAVPDTCTVDPGTDITWRGPPGELIAFEIVFPGESPALHGERAQLRSSVIDGHSRVRIKASDKPGSYKYGIKANDIEVDPAIIIR